MRTEGGNVVASGSNFGCVLRDRALEAPGRPVYTFLSRGVEGPQTVSYRELYDSVMSLAARLGELPRPARALLLYPHGLEFVRALWACLFAGIIPVPCHPPRKSRSADRLHAISQDAQVSIILTDSTVQGIAGAKLAAMAPCLATDGVPAVGSCEAASVLPTDPALLQYTSGSTGDPKGVVITHENLHHNQRLIQAAFQQNSGSTIVCWLPFYHDMGLIGNVLHAAYVGAHAVFMSPADFLSRPLTWLEAISRYGASASGGPNFAYQHCVDRITDNQLGELDLSQWRVAYCGAELVRSQTLSSFAARFAPTGFRPDAFRPCYGIAEATLLVAAADGPVKQSVNPRVDGKPDGDRAPGSLALSSGTVVSCGRPAGGRCLIVDENGALCPEGEVGEIWLSGASIASGYWNNLEASSKAFNCFTRCGQGPFYRSGDLGFLRDGELYVTGRVKELIIVRGRNYYPYDLEWAIAGRSPGVVNDGCAVFSVMRERGEELIVQCEYDRGRGVPHAQVIESIQAVLLEEFGVAAAEVLLVARRHLPRTSSGKLQRALCKSTFLAGASEALVHWKAESGGTFHGQGGDRAPFRPVSETERLIISAVQRLKRSIPICEGDTFFSLGFDSLGMAELASALSMASGKPVSVDLLFECHTIPALGAKMDALPMAGPLPPVSAGPSEAGRAFPLSSIQESIWIDHQSRAPDNRYNIPVRIDFPQTVSRELIAKAFALEVSRAELLHCEITRRDGMLTQAIADKEACALRLVDLSRAQPEEASKELETCITGLVSEPFNLDERPLYRAALIELPGDVHTLIFVAHHLVCDGFSLMAFAQRLLADCRLAADGVAGSTGYETYVLRQRAQLAHGGRFAAEYWRRQLADVVPLRLPRDRWLADDGARGRIASQWMHLSERQSRSLARLAQHNGTTPFAVALSAFATVIGKITRRSDVVIGAPILDRDLAGMKDMFGPCINPVVLRYQLSDDQSGAQRIVAVASGLTEALKHRAVPLREVAGEFAASQSDRRVPLTSVFFNGLTFAPRDQIAAGFLADQGLIARCDLDVYAIFDGDKGASFRWDYDSSLFERETVRLWLAAFETCLHRFEEQKGQPLDGQPLLTPPGRRPLYHSGPPPRTDASRSLASMIRDTMERLPERVAVATPSSTTTFGELLERSRCVRGYLLERETEGTVGLYFHPKDTALAIAAMIAALEAGRRYVVLEPRDPILRLRRIVSDAGVVVVLANGELPWTAEGGAEGAMQRPPKMVLIGEARGAGLAEGVPSGHEPGYVLYTSGTSGVPKGVVQDADNVSYFVEQYRGRLAITERDTLSLVSSLGFDAAVLDVYTAMLTGAQLQVLSFQDNDRHHDLWQWVVEQRITVFHSTPSLYRKLLATRNGSGSGRLRCVVLGGESVLPSDVIRHFELFPNVELYNLYGQSESTLNSLRRFEAEHAARIVTLGRPCDRTSLDVRVEHDGEPEVYEVGEIVVESPHIAKGYLNLPVPTALRFQGSRYLTGDLGRFLPNGEIELVGREDRQLKVNGYRVEPREIESILMSHPAVARARVIKQQGSDEATQLVAYLEVPDDGERTRLDSAEIRGFLARSLPSYMLPSGVCVLPTFPLTPNNKLDVARLPPPEEVLAMGKHRPPQPMTARERAVADCMEGVLGVPVSSGESSFFELGGNSIRVIEFLHRLEKTSGLTLSFKDIFEAATVGGIAARLASAGASAWPALTRSSARSQYPLTSNQTRIWVQSQRTSYNVLASIHVRGGLEPRRLERAIDAVVARHEILRTYFVPVGEEVAQRVVPEPAPSKVLIEQLDASIDQESQLAALETRELHRCFDLTKCPLFQVTYVGAAAPHDVLMLSMHHIICDALSVAVFSEEVLRAYAMQHDSLPKLAIQYGDYSLWLQELGRRGLLNESRAYWTEKLNGGVPALKLRTDRPRGPVKSFAGAVHHGVLDEGLAASTRAFCRVEGVTLFQCLHAVLVLTLFNRTGQTDICVGTLSTGRDLSPHLERQIGFFANTLVLRTKFSGDTRFRELLELARREFLQSHANQSFPLEQLADVLPRPEPGRGLLFDVLLVLHGLDGLEERILGASGLEIGVRDRRECVAKFDLTFNFMPGARRIGAAIEFDSQLFDKDSVDLLWRRFAALLAEVVASPNRRLSEYCGRVAEEDRIAAAGAEIEFDF